MSYVALYRKFRPSTFDDVRGQDHIVKTLKNQVMAGRLQHAYLFCGTRGTGKTTIAKIMAKVVNCEHPVNGNPCNECETCRQIAAGNSMNVIEIDAASNNGVDNIREIVEEVRYRPTQGRYKVYIIDEVHMLSTGAFNALLKTLEEPPEYVIFILATTEVNKIPVTILSRCQRYDFHRIENSVIVSRMADLTKREGVDAETKALQFIARTADGSMRDALSLLDQCMAFYMGEKITYEKVLSALGAADTGVYERLTEQVIKGDAQAAVVTLTERLETGCEAGQFVSDFINYLRNLLMVQTSADIVDAAAEQKKAMRRLSERIPADTLMRYIRVLSELQNSMRYAANRRVLTEIALIKLCKPQMERTEDAFRDRIRILESQMAQFKATGGITAEVESPVYAEEPAEEETAEDYTEEEAVEDESAEQTYEEEDDSEEYEDEDTEETAEEPVEDSVESPQNPPLPEEYPEDEDEQESLAEQETVTKEDLMRVRAMWKDIVSELSSGFFRGVLRNTFPLYKNEEVFKIYLRIRNIRKEGMESNLHELEDIIEKKIGKHIEVVLIG